MKLKLNRSVYSYGDLIIDIDIQEMFINFEYKDIFYFDYNFDPIEDYSFLKIRQSSLYYVKIRQSSLYYLVAT